MYDLCNLGWHAFQQLCLSITRQILGQTVEAFLDAGDAGQDGAFTGCWQQTGGTPISGRFVVQCKFTSNNNKRLTLADMDDEFAKIDRLVAKARCDCYILITNAGISGRSSMNIEERIKASGVKHVLIFGSTWITQQLIENKRLRMMVPRVYGLGDLSQIIDERAYSQASALLESMRDDLAKVVVTNAYRRSAEALDNHGFVLLIGEPASGKSTIASMLSMAAIDQWQSTPLKLDNPESVVRHWNPHEPSQFFWIDDAFGVTQYESFLVYGWNRALPMVSSMLRRGAKIVMTSRDYIYRRARTDLKEGSFPLFREGQVVIDVHDLAHQQRNEKLYNHLKLGLQPKSFLSSIKTFLPMIAAHPRFVPELAPEAR